MILQVKMTKDLESIISVKPICDTFDDFLTINAMSIFIESGRLFSMKKEGMISHNTVIFVDMDNTFSNNWYYLDIKNKILKFYRINAIYTILG